MKRFLSSIILAAAVSAVALPISSSRAADEPVAGVAQNAGAGIPVKAVVLFSSGVGYFEHFGSVNGNASTELRFKTRQINDILKSLVLEDLDGGRVTTITYPSQDPIDVTLRSFQVDITGNPPLADLLNQLRGARVTVELAGEKIEGTILGIEAKEVPTKDDKTIKTFMLNLIAGASIRSLPLDDVRGLTLEDAGLQEELNKALTALASARDQNKKPVTLNFAGEGERRVRIGYVVETPVWKTSYRLVMGEKAQLQGWAIVENQTDNDWNNVQMSLVSGRPISFVQDLYQPLYIPRPVVRPELYASLNPQTYDGGMDELAKEKAEFGIGGGEGNGKQSAERSSRQLQNRRREMNAPAAPMASDALASGREQDKSYTVGEIDVTSSVSSVASASKVGELFQYTVGNVSLPRQRSAMIPIVTDPIEVERVSIYNASVLAKNPLNGARVKNTTEKHLLAGPITVFDANTYAGDAQIDNLPPNQERLLSYGIDLQTHMLTENANQTNAIQTAKIVKGVLQIRRKLVASMDYVAENKADKVKTLIIEHPFRAGWTLVSPEKYQEKTDTLYRFKGEIEPGKQTRLNVKEEIVTGEEIAILPYDVGTLEAYSRTGEIPQPVRDALTKAIQLKYAMVDTQRKLAEAQQRIATIRADQSPIRENLKAINDKNDPTYNRYLKKFAEQEAEIDTLEKNTIPDLQKLLQTQQQELEAYVGALEVG